MEKDKGKRYQSAGELRSELINIEKRIPTTGRIVPKIKPITSREITVKFSLRKLYVPALVILGLAIAGVIIWQLLPQKEAVPLAPTGKPSIAIMYFENRSDETELDKILVDMLTTNLSRYEEIEVVSSQRLFDILKQLGKQDVKAIDKNVATDVAIRAGVKNMMMGSIIRIGDKIRITSQLTDVQTGAIIGSEQVEGNKIEEIFDMVDLLTEKVRNKLGVSAEEVAQPYKIADVTTSSFEAYKYYRKGLENIWRWKRQDAKKNFEQAIEVDPTFAMAHLGLARVEGFDVFFDPFVDFSTIRKSIQLAKQYATKATNKERRYIDIYNASYNGQNEKAYRLAADLVNDYPNEKEAYNLLRDTSWFLRKLEQSIEATEKVLELDPTYANAYNYLAYDYSRIHNHEKAISSIKKYLALQPDNWNPYDSAWEIYMRAGLYDEAIQICDDALEINKAWPRLYLYQAYSLLFKGEREKAFNKIRQFGENFPDYQEWELYDLGLLFLYEGKYEEALTEFKKSAEIFKTKKNVSWEMRVHFDMGKLFTEMGQYSRALDEFAKAGELSTQIYDESFSPIPILFNYLAGIAMVKKRDYRAAQGYASKIEKFIQNKNYDILNMDYYHLLNGEIYVAQGNGQAALDSLAKVSIRAEFFSPRFMILKPASLALMGEAEKAISSYLRSCNEVERRTHSMGDYFYYFLESSRVDYYVAKVYEGQGNTPKTIEHYQKFLDLWKEADPGFPEVEDAKKKQAALKSQ